MLLNAIILAATVERVCGHPALVMEGKAGGIEGAEGGEAATDSRQGWRQGRLAAEKGFRKTCWLSTLENCLHVFYLLAVARLRLAVIQCHLMGRGGVLKGGRGVWSGYPTTSCRGRGWFSQSICQASGQVLDAMFMFFRCLSFSCPYNNSNNNNSNNNKE